MSDGSPGWYGLGPLSVLPPYQRQGIGGALIHEGLSRLKGLGARGCCLVGHPAYYQRFGFQHPGDLATRAFRKTPSLPCHSMATYPRAALSSTKDSKRLANNTEVGDAPPAPRPSKPTP